MAASPADERPALARHFAARAPRRLLAEKGGAASPLHSPGSMGSPSRRPLEGLPSQAGRDKPSRETLSRDQLPQGSQAPQGPLGLAPRNPLNRTGSAALPGSALPLGPPSPIPPNPVGTPSYRRADPAADTGPPPPVLSSFSSSSPCFPSCFPLASPPSRSPAPPVALTCSRPAPRTSRKGRASPQPAVHQLAACPPTRRATRTRLVKPALRDSYRGPIIATPLPEGSKAARPSTAHSKLPR